MYLLKLDNTPNNIAITDATQKLIIALNNEYPISNKKLLSLNIVIISFTTSLTFGK